VYGATGFTGKLVAEYISAHPSLPSDFKWCVAGRSRSKLEALVNEIDLETAKVANWRGAPPPAVVVVDSTDDEALESLALSAKVIVTTVGP
jgi:short subunit dehydrogenase-like uncharacterized protein